MNDMLTALALAVHKLTNGEPVTLTPEDTAKSIGIKIDLLTDGDPNFTVAVVEDKAESDGN